jgi:hypothetical protein
MYALTGSRAAPSCKCDYVGLMKLSNKLPDIYRHDKRYLPLGSLDVN